jgi:putative PIN family toxin of toxin-antitoxin system
VRAVADTNVYISALNFGGLPDEVLALARQGQIQLCISVPILAEIEGVLLRKFAWSEPRVRQALQAIREFTELIHPEETLAVIADDEPDNRILECALAARAEVIITGDTHLRTLKVFRGIRLLSPAECLTKWRR